MLKCFKRLIVFTTMENNYLMLNQAPAAPDKEQELAILFLDIRNFTSLMESQPSQTVIQIVRRLFTAFGQIVKKFEGRVVEIAGDSLYVVFGLQTELKASVNNAYQAVQLMFQTVSLFNEAYAEPYYGGPLEIGVGLHAGKVFVGEFGLDNEPQLSVMGLPVNIASRLQAKTRELDNDLIISEDAYQLLLAGDQVIARPQTVQLQGISQGQQVRLAGKPYATLQNLDYLLAISG
ncbi:MAG TPA: adenylate/guanylate cyclase domain-containing protein [Mucilaginibacter sp.]|nr:adenylate/guanylate cyclase domain-containing protein [Mucilaginibacter sp.]